MTKRDADPDNGQNHVLWQLPAVFAFGVIFIAVLLVIAIYQPDPTPFSRLIFGLVAALAAGGVAALIPGAFEVQLPLSVKAGGALGVTALVFFSFWKGFPEPGERYRLPAPFETGWIFVGYVDKNSPNFSEGPYVSISSSNRKIREKYVESGDIVKLNVSRELIIVNYKNGGGDSMLSPSKIPGGAIRSIDRTGIKLPKNTQWIVRDVMLAGFSSSPYLANWIRIAEPPE